MATTSQKPQDRVLVIVEKNGVADRLAQFMSADGRINTHFESDRTQSSVLNYFASNKEICTMTIKSVNGSFTDLSFKSAADTKYGSSIDKLFHAEVDSKVDPKKRKLLERLHSEAKNSKFVYLLTDFDTEGEHFASELKKFISEFETTQPLQIPLLRVYSPVLTKR